MSDPAFIERLHKLIEIAGSASSLVKKANISHGGLSRYLAGGEPSRRVIIALASATNVRIEWLMSGTGIISDLHGTPEPSSTLRLISLLHASEEAPQTGSIRQEFTAHAFCHIWLTHMGLDESTLVAMKIMGNSMEPTLKKGTVVLIDTAQQKIEDGCIYLFEESGNDMVRRIHNMANNKICALADNSQHQPFVTDATQITIRGRVVWCGHML